MRKNANVYAVFVLCLAFFAKSVESAELKGVNFPDTYTLENKTLILNGLGLRSATVFKVSVYVGALYLEQKSQDAEAILASAAPKVVAMEFLREVDQKKIVESYRESLEKSCADQCAALKPSTEKFLSALEAMNKGEQMKVHLSSAGVELFVKGAFKGIFAGEGFARVMLEVWLGKNPPNKELKQGMLGIQK